MTTRHGLAAALVLLIALTLTPMARGQEKLRLPYREAGLSDREAAAFLLDRLAFGARPGEVDRVVKMGLANWVEQQIAGDLPEPEVERRLTGFPALTMTPEKLADTYVGPGRLLKEARDAGVVPQEFAPGEDKKTYRQAVIQWAKQQGYHLPREMVAQMMAQKLIRGVYSENQLHEVLTDFWFNHFNVSLTDNKCRVHILSYERDAIRPHVMGRFRDLLGATAKHPAMLLYLDNAQSTAAPETRTTLDDRVDEMPAATRTAVRSKVDQAQQRLPQGLRKRGINENFARELMELHTLGVDGGYTQKDVTEVARVLTGWTVNPVVLGRKQAKQRLEKVKSLGLVVDGGFLFRPDTHDSTAKVILGQNFPAGGGLDEGERVLDMLAAHPSTARFVTHKLACWFVCDQPPASLEQRLAASFSSSGGDMRTVMRTLVQSPEFWQQARRSKIKSPFELTISALRALDADVKPTRALYEWVKDMGEPLYGYQAPTGFPDRAESWVNPGSLLTRMNFGLSLAAGQVDGVRIDLGRLAGGRAPADRKQALELYCQVLLPGRDHRDLVEKLTPLASNPNFARQVAEKAAQTPAPGPAMADLGEEEPPAPKRKPMTGPLTPTAQVVGVILGSPEFQRQ